LSLNAKLKTSETAVTKPALVFLCQRLPYPPTTGEKITSFNFLRHLCTKYRVFLGTFIDNESDREHLPALRAMLTDMHVSEIRKPQVFVKAFPKWLLGDPISFAIFRDRKLSKWLEKVESNEKPVAVFTHSSNISGYAVDHFQRSEGNEPIRVLHFADVDSEKFAAYASKATGLKKLIFSIESARVKRQEQRLTDMASHVAVISDDEANVLRSTLSHHQDRVVTLPNGVDTDLFDRSKYPVAPFEANGKSIVFTGAMDYPPNIEAVSWFAENVFPSLKRRIPDVKFLIVGTRPSAEVKKLGELEGIIVTGRVDSTAAYMAHADVAVAPIRIARGVQNKVLEAMAMSLPVVVSPEALVGIAATPDKHLVLADSAESWVVACAELIENKPRSAELGIASRELVCDLYNWSAQFARLDSYLEQ
jgi:polysaccharide biosynthesis protein PslH